MRVEEARDFLRSVPHEEARRANIGGDDRLSIRDRDDIRLAEQVALQRRGLGGQLDERDVRFARSDTPDRALAPEPTKVRSRRTSIRRPRAISDR